MLWDSCMSRAKSNALPVPVTHLTFFERTQSSNCDLGSHALLPTALLVLHLSPECHTHTLRAGCLTSVAELLGNIQRVHACIQNGGAVWWLLSQDWAAASSHQAPGQHLQPVSLVGLYLTDTAASAVCLSCLLWFVRDTLVTLLLFVRLLLIYMVVQKSRPLDTESKEMLLHLCHSFRPDAEWLSKVFSPSDLSVNFVTKSSIAPRFTTCEKFDTFLTNSGHCPIFLFYPVVSALKWVMMLWCDCFEGHFVCTRQRCYLLLLLSVSV